jgi:tryptophanyl-tRNA synthetase
LVKNFVLFGNLFFEVGSYAVKEDLIEGMNTYLRPMRQRRSELEKSPEIVVQTMQEGGKKARAVATKKLAQVRSLIGLI